MSKTKLHPGNWEACDTLDALLYNGDPSEDELIELKAFIANWQRLVADLLEKQRCQNATK